MALELLSALEARLGRTLDAEVLARAQTVGQLSAALDRRPLLASSRTSHIEEIAGDDLNIPEPLREAAMAWLGRGADSFYARLMRRTCVGALSSPTIGPRSSSPTTRVIWTWGS